MNFPLITVITPTTGNIHLNQAIQSVAQQSYPYIQHLIMVDGQAPKAMEILSHYRHYAHLDIVQLPYNIGTRTLDIGGHTLLGHPSYGMGLFLAKGDWICFLDEDNWFSPEHIAYFASILQQEKNANFWAYALRNIVAQTGDFICQDNCESLGGWLSVGGYHLIDTNCYFLPRHLALQFGEIFYHPFMDRLLSQSLLQQSYKICCTGEYTVNYRLGNRIDSVKAKFFLQGNDIMANNYPSPFPWQSTKHKLKGLI
ncbi:glycosyltransferase family 2 protein [Avibacterium sp. 20-126]|uniref:glycosyltransferase family A protein n=1 Tax=Avibacterium sp. 20-126 TaxID=2911524 RepID=UPI0021889DEE|nr:glycosyltransferase family 2 protein [Avibacterium sp. 20-126]